MLGIILAILFSSVLISASILFCTYKICEALKFLKKSDQIYLNNKAVTIKRPKEQ